MTSGITAEDIVRLFEEDTRARKRLAELLTSEPDVRLVIINAVLRDVATKQDLKELREEFRREIDGLQREVSGLRERVARLEGVVAQLAERIADLDKRIDALDKRIDSLDKRIDALDKRMDSLEKRMDYMAKVTLALTGSVLATLVADIILRLVLHIAGQPIG